MRGLEGGELLQHVRLQEVNENIERGVWGEGLEIHFQLGSELLSKLISADLFRV